MWQLVEPSKYANLWFVYTRRNKNGRNMLNINRVARLIPHTRVGNRSFMRVSGDLCIQNVSPLAPKSHESLCSRVLYFQKLLPETVIRIIRLIKDVLK